MLKEAEVRLLSLGLEMTGSFQALSLRKPVCTGTKLCGHSRIVRTHKLREEQPHEEPRSRWHSGLGLSHVLPDELSQPAGQAILVPRHWRAQRSCRRVGRPLGETQYYSANGCFCHHLLSVFVASGTHCSAVASKLLLCWRVLSTVVSLMQLVLPLKMWKLCCFFFKKKLFDVYSFT